MTRPLILGMNNPHGAGDPLSPHEGAGRRLRGLLPALSLEEYLAAFERRNLLPGSVWSDWRARAAARELLPALRGRDVIVLGKRVWAAFRTNAPHVPFFAAIEWSGVRFHLLPHPSGRSLALNDPETRAAASVFLESVMRKR